MLVVTEKEKLALDDSWKMIDIADIMEEQAKNKHLIEESLLDGQIDAEELEAITWMLKRSGLKKDKKEQVSSWRNSPVACGL